LTKKKYCLLLALLFVGSACKRINVRGNKMAEMSLGTNARNNLEDVNVKGWMAEVTCFR
jgi:hypothetical protein